VYNRRYLDEALKEQFAFAREKQQPLTVIMVDLDHFRDINEAFGRETGDMIIHEAVRVFKRHLRPEDILARYGGDEFTILMPNTTADEGLAIARRICAETAKIDMLKARGGEIERITTSQGMATYPECAGNMEELRELADRALYRAKEEGRNRVVAAAKR
jgi:diguanylate cyclase (GGDEF)-like protein